MATKLVKSIWALINPKPPKQAPKKAPKEHLAAKCGFPSRSEAEWGMLMEEEGKPPMDEQRAVDLLMRLAQMTLDRDKWEGAPEDKPRVDRADMMWAIKREKAFVKVRPLEHEEYKSGATGASILCELLARLNKEKIAWGDPPQQDVWHAMERFDFDAARAEYWLKAMGVLMGRQLELGVESREEVEKAMDRYDNNPDRVIELFIDASALLKQGGELGNPSRADTKLVLDTCWEAKHRTKLAAAVLKSLTSLCADETAMLNIGVEGKPTADDKAYIASALKRFDGNRDEGMAFMKKVADIVHQGEDLGDPSREVVIEALVANKMDQRVATRKLREAYRDVKDAQLKDAYRRNLEEERRLREDKQEMKAAVAADKEGAN